MSDQGKERRRFDRIPSDMEVRYSQVDSDKNFIGKLVNLNGTGVCFESDHAIDAGSRVNVATLDGDTVVPILDGVIEVVRCIDRGAGKFEIAGEFKELQN
jgi:hypothetical protein